jgi:hypothetical protein
VEKFWIARITGRVDARWWDAPDELKRQVGDAALVAGLPGGAEMSLDPDTDSVSAVVDWSESADPAAVTQAAQAFFDAFVTEVGVDADLLSLTAVLTA